jgi:hypothetical protein
MSTDTTQQIADQLIVAVKGYVNRHAVAHIKALEQRIVELEERLRAVDGKKAHIPNHRNL